MGLLHFISRLFLSVFFVVAGINHFLSPALYLSIMPSFLPTPLFLVNVSGIAEIIGGVAIQIPALRRPAGWGLLLLLLAVFPANIYALQNGMIISGHSIERWILLARLPVQLLFMAWVYLSCGLKLSFSSQRNL